MHHHLEIHSIGFFVDEEVAVGDVEADFAWRKLVVDELRVVDVTVVFWLLVELGDWERGVVVVVEHTIDSQHSVDDD